MALCACSHDEPRGVPGEETPGEPVATQDAGPLVDVGKAHAGSPADDPDAGTPGSAGGSASSTATGCTAQELCADGLDNDCDARADEGCVCASGETQDCYTGSEVSRGVGACHDGVVSCEISDGMAEWGVDCVGSKTPATELCGNTVDEDCDGNLDDGCACDEGETDDCYPGSDETRGVGACHDGLQHCEVEDGVAVWGTDCDGAVTPEPEVCGNEVDEDCDDELDEGCAPIECPDDLTVPAGRAASLMVGGDELDDYAFAITSGPVGGATTAVWTGRDPGLPSAQLTAYIIGEYTIHVSARDASNALHECSFKLTALPHGLRVQLRWDGSGDVDLHLHDDSASPWFNAVDDCYWSNRNPAWGAVLDLDSIVGSGPENIRVDSPVVGVAYYVGVHHYAMAAGRIATVEVFCGDTTSTTPQQTFVSRALTGTENNNCTNNDFWRVARVTFTGAATCTIQSVDDYVPSATACTAL